MKRFMLISSIFIINLVVVSYGLAQDENLELEKIVVTPYRYAADVSGVASSVTVISQQAINNSNAHKTIDILRTVPGLVVRDWYGNATKASVDIRGFGEQANLNVLVLIDGRRANEVDLSGVDWTQIPLDQVERIEIVRGGSGSVLYGDNAVSGVINIITKKGKGKPRLDFKSEYGSYDFNSQKIGLSGSQNEISYLFTASREGTHGYRNNSFHKAQDFSSNLGYALSDDSFLRFSSTYHKSSFGLPASLKQSVIDQYNRRYARNIDHANEKDYYILLGGEKEFQDFGNLDIDVSYRRRTVNSYFPTLTAWGMLNTLRTRIHTFGLTPKYTLENNLFKRQNKLIAGFDYYRCDYSANSYNAVSEQLENFTDTNKISLAGYLQDEFSILDKLTLVAGYRYERAKFEFDYHDNTGPNPDIDKNIRPNKKAFNAGLVYNYQRDSRLFLNISRSFRFPAVDEFAYNDAFWQQQLNTDLKPQISTNYELGIRNRFNDNFKADLSLFLMKVKDELYYNSTGGPLGFGQNQNYDKTIHEGTELSFDLNLNRGILFFGNYAFTKAFFEGGEYKNNDIPLVPRHKTSVGLRFLLPKNITLNILGNYVGERYFLNDQANVFSRLNAYMTADINISYQFKDFSAICGVNNIFDKKYAEYAGIDHNDNNQKFYYPSPTRNFNLKLEYKF